MSSNVGAKSREVNNARRKAFVYEETAAFSSSKPKDGRVMGIVFNGTVELMTPPQQMLPSLWQPPSNGLVRGDLVPKK